LRPNAAKADVVEEIDVAVSISAVLLLLILAVIFVRNGGLKISHALVCLLLGFFLAGTSMAPTIHSGLTATADIVGSLRP
jgi:hypothetical protein